MQGNNKIIIIMQGNNNNASDDWLLLLIIWCHVWHRFRRHVWHQEAANFMHAIYHFSNFGKQVFISVVRCMEILYVWINLAHYNNKWENQNNSKVRAVNQVLSRTTFWSHKGSGKTACYMDFRSYFDSTVNKHQITSAFFKTQLDVGRKLTC